MGTISDADIVMTLPMRAPKNAIDLTGCSEEWASVRRKPNDDSKTGFKGMSSERRTQIIAVRVPPTAKKRILGEAQKREETLTEFMWEIIGAGWNIVVKQNKSELVKQ